MLGGDPRRAESARPRHWRPTSKHARERPFGVIVVASAKSPVNREQRIVTPVAMPGRRMLDAAAHIIPSGETEPGHRERVEDPKRVCHQKADPAPPTADDHAAGPARHCRGRTLPPGPRSLAPTRRRTPTRPAKRTLPFRAATLSRYRSSPPGASLDSCPQHHES